MSFLLWLETSWLAEWVSTSLIGYPLMITSHAIGMSIMVGIALILDLRLLGKFQGIPYPTIQPFLGLAWLGFGLNFLSGAALFTTQAASYVQDWTFVSKMVFVFAGAATAGMLQTAVSRDSASWTTTGAPSRVRAIAWLSIACWILATVTGRLIAYL